MADPIKDTNEIPDEDDVEEEKEESAEEGKEGEGNDPKDPKEGEDDEDPEVEDDESDPPTRKSPKDFIIARQKKKLEKVKEEKEKKNNQPDPDEDSEEEEEAGDDNQPVKKKDLKPIVEGVRNQSDEMEWRDVKAKHPAAARYEKIIKRYMAHPAYENVPVESIYFIIAGKYGGGTKAAKDEKKNITGGHQRRQPESDGKLPDFDKMTDDQIDTIAFKVKTGQKI